MAWNFNPMQHKSTLGNPTMAGAAALVNAEMSGVDRIAGGLDAYNKENAIAKKRAELEAKGYTLDENGKVLKPLSKSGVSGLSGRKNSSKNKGKNNGQASTGTTGSQQSLAEAFAKNKARVAELTTYLAAGNGSDRDKGEASLLLEKLKAEQVQMLPAITKNFKLQGKLTNIGETGGIKSLKGKKSSKTNPAGKYADERKIYRNSSPFVRSVPLKEKYMVDGIWYNPDGSKLTEKNRARYLRKKVKALSESLVADTGLPKHL